jgi:hypothetical protein
MTYRHHYEATDPSHTPALDMSQYNAEDVDIPTIDISDATSAVAQQVLDAASTHGFLFVQQDGSLLPMEDVDDMFKPLPKKTPIPSTPKPRAA